MKYKDIVRSFWQTTDPHYMLLQTPTGIPRTGIRQAAGMAGAPPQEEETRKPCEGRGLRVMT